MFLEMKKTFNKKLQFIYFLLFENKRKKILEVVKQRLDGAIPLLQLLTSSLSFELK